MRTYRSLESGRLNVFLLQYLHVYVLVPCPCWGVSVTESHRRQKGLYLRIQRDGCSLLLSGTPYGNSFSYKQTLRGVDCVLADALSMYSVS